MNELSGFFGFFALIMGIIWIIFPFTVAHGITKQRQANRRIVEQLEAIAKELRELNAKTASPLARAASANLE